MLVNTIDGKQCEWKPLGKNKKRYKRSQLHRLAINCVQALLPSTPIVEECFVPLYSHEQKKHRFDIYLPMYGIVLEVDGAQHDKPNSHFHKGPSDFTKQKQLDNAKDEWAELNDILLVRLRHNEDEFVWQLKISEAIRQAIRRNK